MVGVNLIPLENIFRYIPPLMHLVMGLANDTLDELKKDVVKADDEEMGNESNNDHKEKIKEKLVELYADAEDLEAKLSNTSLAKMVVLNDKKRVPFLKRGMTKEANIVSKENYVIENHEVENERQSCDAECCLLFSVDVEHDWDQMLTCKYNCQIHLRCEGIALVNEDEELPEDYICVQCQKNKPNSEWIEEALEIKNEEFSKIQRSLNLEIANVKAETSHYEHIEESKSGPRQRKLKKSLKVLGDVAMYHGGALQTLCSL